MEDPRQPSNAQRYSLRDLVLGAVAVFYMQRPSFLEHQRHMQRRHGSNYAQRIFGVTAIPTPNQIKNVVDGVSATRLFPVFGWGCQALAAQGWLKRYEVLGGEIDFMLDDSTPAPMGNTS